MRLIVTRIISILTKKTHLSIPTVCLGQNIKLDEVKIDHKAALQVGENTLPCTVTRAVKNLSGSFNCLLSFPDRLSTYQIMHPYHHKSNLNFPLILEETASLADVSEVDQILTDLSKKERRSRSDLLYELTSFKEIPGKRDLSLVSGKQLPVLRDKILRRLDSGDGKESTRA